MTSVRSTVIMPLNSYLLRARTKKPAERRLSASAGFAIDSTRGISEPGLALGLHSV
jgi:hypothetical protein